ncbi:MAG: hypothetical protein E6018_09405 [Clostridium perfringens]|nr:hypothetical protein [Clostridium perfringens]MDU5659414.1 hypothetical protein [Clostridium perfringens]BDA26857.1 hypothetical protein CPBEC2_30860 [Clostridium perfringens]
MNFYQTLSITLITVFLTSIVNLLNFLFKEYYTNNIKEFEKLRRKTLELFMKYGFILNNPVDFSRIEIESELKDSVYKVKFEFGELISKWFSYSSKKNKLFCKRKTLGNDICSYLLILQDGLTYYKFDSKDLKEYELLVKRNKEYKKKIENILN